MANWSFLTNHGRVLLCIARDPEVRLRDIAGSLAITERRAHGIVTDLTEAGYIVKIKDGRRNRYEIQAHQQFSELFDVVFDGHIPPTEDESPDPDGEELVRPVGPNIRIDLTRLAQAKGQDAEMVARLLDSIQQRRSSRSRRFFTLRHEDLELAAAVIGRETDDVVASLQESGVLNPPRGRPPGRRA